jgi:cation diffusion facilitator CzcD-associated flavoprotein CzcO
MGTAMSASNPHNGQEPASEHWPQNGRQPRIAIIGAGMSGIAAVVKLEKAGYTDLTVFEKADRVGGTWRENTYPGLSCDVPSRWYCFSFALKADWPHRYSYGPDIQAYMEAVARDFGVLKHVRFNTGISDLTYQEPGWQVTTAEGSVEQFDIVISATGILHKPAYPDIQGLENFSGAQFHSARWDHSVGLKGKRVGVIGTGSTAAQIVGAITADVDKMTVFQRTPQWLVPLPQKKYSALWNKLVDVIPGMKWLCYHYYLQKMVRMFSAATVGSKFWQSAISKTAQKQLDEGVADPELRAKLTPDYQATCKRLIFCSDFYPAISRPNAQLVTESIKQIEDTGVRTSDGELHELDVLVLATGFDAGAFILPTTVTGKNGKDLEGFWDGAPRAHRSVAIPGFPNFWMLEGPTGPVGNLSLITITEHQVDYIISMLDHMKANSIASVHAKTSAFQAYNDAMADGIGNTTWATGGCTSWYFDKSGKPNLYPFLPTQYLKDMHNPDFLEYVLSD